MSWCEIGVTFDLGSARMPCLRHIYFTFTLFFTFILHREIWIAATDYYMYFYLIVLSSLTAILKLVNFTASKCLICLLILLICYCLVLILYLHIHLCLSSVIAPVPLHNLL